jgi:hypothetical protein
MIFIFFLPIISVSPFDDFNVYTFNMREIKDTAEAMSLSCLFLINVIVFYQLYCISYFKLIV